MGRSVHALLLVVLAAAGATVAQSDGPVSPRFQVPGAIALGPAPPRGRQLSSEGPAPPRFQVPGAIPLGAAPPRARPAPGPAPAGRVRRPLARQQAYLPTPITRNEVTPPPPPPPPPPTVQPTLPPRPVAEEVEEYDDLDDVTPTPLVSALPPSPQSPIPSVRQQLRAGPDRPIQVQVASPVPISIADIPVHAPAPARPAFRQPPAFRPEPRPQAARPAPAPAPAARPHARRPQPIPIEDDSPPPTARQQFRQQVRPAPAEPRPQEQFVRPQQKQPQPYSPYKNRERKPVAQVLNKYRNDNPDGSITWGYENDDGSFKEETIGVDCVVRGKYGYVDPDGNRREYTYSSGIPCDKSKEEEQPEGDQGYIDYQNNAYVLPNGQSVPIQAAAKNKGRRPQPPAYGK